MEGRGHVMRVRTAYCGSVAFDWLACGSRRFIGASNMVRRWRLEELVWVCAFANYRESVPTYL